MWIALFLELLPAGATGVQEESSAGRGGNGWRVPVSRVIYDNFKSLVFKYIGRLVSILLVGRLFCGNPVKNIKSGMVFSVFECQKHPKA